MVRPIGSKYPVPEPSPRGFTLQIICTALGTPHEFDGMYVVEYDLGMWTEDELEHRKPMPIKVTRNKAKAKVFADAADAFACWQQDTGRLRVDGKPDRPLTAFTVEVVKA